jgi:hypothetical protein
VDLQTVKHIVKEELPGLVRTDKRIRKFVLDLTREVNLEKADKQETESRFDRMMEELKRDREVQSRKWDEQNKKWDEQNKKWDEQNKRWEKNHEEIEKLLKIVQRHDTALGAVGARWGGRAESSFRNGLKWILEENFGVKVININEYDEEGEVYGRPDQVELDILIINSTLIICEVKSSLSKGEMYLFHRKAKFYEKRHHRQANYLIVISPMVEEKAQVVARELGIKVFSYVDDIPPDIFS